MWISETILSIFIQSTFILPAYLAWTSLLFVVCILIGVQVIFIMLIKKNRGRASVNKIRSELVEWISMVALEESEECEKKLFELPATIESLLKQKLAKKVLMAELLQLKKSFSGSAADNLRALYEQLKLNDESIKKLNSRKWHLITKGIQELAMMNQVDCVGDILKLTNHRNADVRMESQAAMVHMLGYKGLSFLGMIEYPLTEWNQLSLLHMLEHKPVSEYHQVGDWLKSKNLSVVKFTIRLISQQHLLEYEQSLRECLSHDDEAIRVAALVALEALDSPPDEYELVDLYAQGCNHIRMEIIQCAAKAANKELLYSLLHLQEKFNNAELKLRIQKALQKLSDGDSYVSPCNKSIEENPVLQYA